MSVYRGQIYDRLDIQRLFFHIQLLEQEKTHYQLYPFVLNGLSQENIIPTFNRIIIELLICFRSNFLTDLQFDHAISKILTYYECLDIIEIDLLFNRLHDIFQHYLPYSNGFIAEYI